MIHKTRYYNSKNWKHMGNHGHLKSVTGKTHNCQRTAVHQTDNFSSINYNIVVILIIVKMWLINL